jgi:hypothetical protein
MKIRNAIIPLVLVGYLTVMSTTANSQSPEMKVRFKVDGQEVKKPEFKVLIQVNGQTLEPKITNDGFTVPQEIGEYQKIDVRFISGKYDLLFSSLTRLHFDSEWVIGVDNPPFEIQDDDSPPETGKDLVLIYFIEFHPEHAEGTRWVTKVYR